MRRLNQIAATVLIVVAVLLGHHAFGLQFYTRIGPGPGFFPLVLCVLLAIFAAAHLINVSFAPAEPLATYFPGTKQAYLRMSGIVTALAVLAGLMPLVGFRLGMFGFYVATFVLCGRHRPVEIIVLSVIGSVGIHYILTVYLHMPLPSGLVGI